MNAWQNCFSAKNIDKYLLNFLIVFLLVSSSMPYVSGKKFDIQFTFNRLPVQMEHRACERINRPAMRPVLFPQEESLDQRGEINKQVRFVPKEENNKDFTRTVKILAR